MWGAQCGGYSVGGWSIGYTTEWPDGTAYVIMMASLQPTHKYITMELEHHLCMVCSFIATLSVLWLQAVGGTIHTHPLLVYPLTRSVATQPLTSIVSPNVELISWPSLSSPRPAANSRPLSLSLSLGLCKRRWLSAALQRREVTADFKSIHTPFSQHIFVPPLF